MEEAEQTQGALKAMDSMSRARQSLRLLTKWMTEKVEPTGRVSFPLELAGWQKELDLIRGQIERPDQVRVALVGSTGAGKSTFLNAVLGQEVLPVGVMEPCTAFVTLVRHRAGVDYEVSVQFASVDEWRRDLEAFVAYLKPGDVDADPESKRLINAARKRVEAVLGLEVTDDIAPDSLLSRPLPAEAQAIFNRSVDDRRVFAGVKDMLDYLRKLIRGESTLWPLVKQVTISGPYECLQGGLELVDLPGLNDPNEARVEVTREFLRTSPFVWVMFPMVRGLTHDIQSILQDEKLLRTLVLSGTYSALSLIGTKADDIDSNIATQLGLSEDCELSDLVREYRGQTIAKARSQLEQMVRDLATPADHGETLTRMLSLAREAEVHATSASAYIKLKGIARLRRDYGIDSLEETGIPEVHRLLRKIAAQTGAEFSANTAIKRIEQLSAEVAFFFGAKAKGNSPEIERTRAKLHEELAGLQTRIAAAESRAKTRLEAYREQFLAKVGPLLRSSVQEVQRTCQGWQAIQWATLRAVVTRDGTFKSPSTGKCYDLNAELTDPLLSQLPVSWERYFTDELGRVRDDFVSEVNQAGEGFSHSARLIVDLMFHRRDALVEKQLAWFQEKVSLLAQTSRNRLVQAVTERRRELASKMPLVARQSMLPAYSSAKTESGTGMKARMLGRLMPTAIKAAPPIYDTIQTDLLEGLADLEVIILRLLRELADTANEQARIVAHNAAVDIDDASADPELKAILDTVPKLP